MKTDRMPGRQLELTRGNGVMRLGGLDRGRGGVPRTNPIEVGLAFAFAAFLPVNEFIVRKFDLSFSVIQVLSAVALAYCLIFRGRLFLRIVLHPVFLLSYVFLGVITFMEFLHPYPGLRFIGSLARMLLASMALATILRDKKTLRAMAAGVLFAGVLFGVSMVGSYGFLRSVSATDFYQASRTRAQLEEQMPVYDNLNAIGFWLLQATLVALVIGTRTRRVVVRWALLAASAFFLVCSFLPMSRSAVLIVAMTISYYLFRFHKVSFRTLLTATFLILVVLVAVPPVVFSRMHFNVFSPEMRHEGRSYVYRAIVREFPRYALLGVGNGNFWKSWGRRSSFAKKDGFVIGPHNGPATVLIFWGFPGFVALTFVGLALFRRVRALGQSVEEMLVSVFAVGGVGLFLVVHNFYNKEFSFLIALPVAAHYWGVEWRAMRVGRKRLVLRLNKRPSPGFNRSSVHDIGTNVRH